MRNLWLIVKREYLQRVRTKGFIISTLLMPALFAALFVVPIFLARMQTGEPKKVAVVDETDALYDALVRAVEEKADKERPQFLLSRVDPSPDGEALERRLREQVNGGQIHAYVVIPADILQSGKAAYHGKNVSNVLELRTLESTLNNVVITRRLGEVGMDPARVKAVIGRVDMRRIRITREGATEDRGQAFIVAYVMVMVLYGSLLGYGMTIMRSVLEEKSSRVVEVLVSSVRPSELMFGKLIGVGAVGLTQTALWSVVALAFSWYGQAMASAVTSAGMVKVDIPAGLLGYFVVFYVLGFFLYGSMYAALGAAVNSEQDAQQMQIPIMSFLIIPLVLMMFIINNPNSNLAVGLSLVPFFTPLLMFMRLCIQPPPVWQVLASVLLMALTTGVIMIGVSKIYRVGILMYGKRPNIPELVRWLRYT